MILQYDELKYQTKLARLFMFDNHEVWIPESQIMDIDLDECRVEVPDWLAEERGLEEYEV